MVSEPLRRAVLLGISVVAWGCSPLGPSPEPSFRIDLDRQESIVFRGTDYVTSLRGVAIEGSDLIPVGTAILAHTAVIDPSVWALPGIDPSKLVVLRTPPGFDEPGWDIGEFIYFTRKGLFGTVTEACPYYADPTPGCPNMYASPTPS
jgi:hypothetical protein